MKSKINFLLMIVLFGFLSFSLCFAAKDDSSTILSVQPFMDVRWKDLRNVDNLSNALISTLTFNRKTIWPKDIKHIANNIMKAGMNPGFGIKQLHKKGITGKGVNLAIIDQNLFLNHPEFSGKIIKYYDTGCNAEDGSMHGPAVTSLLIGRKIGTAPDARIYYAAVPTWKLDAEYYAKALEWVIEENRKLPDNKKIRIVSVSAAPSGIGSNFTVNTQKWDEACLKANQENILVLDCTEHRSILQPCYYDIESPDNISQCNVGFPGMTWYVKKDENHIYAPTSFRTQAEEYDKGKHSYQFSGCGGLSWAIPYVTGVLALGIQIRPDISNDELVDLLFKSAFLKDEKYKIINPEYFIELVKRQNINKKELKAL
jgi:serine protease AprX